MTRHPVPTVFRCVASRNKRERAHRPGLPRRISWRTGQCQRTRIQLVVRVLRFGRLLSWHVFEFQYAISLSQRRERPRLRFSVALPLGINGDERHAKDGRVYPIRLDLANGASVSATRIASCGPTPEMAPAGPRGSASRNCTAPVCEVRPRRAPPRRSSVALAKDGDSSRNRAIRSQFKRTKPAGPTAT